MAEHSFAEKGWAHGLRSGVGRGPSAGMRSVHAPPPKGRRARSAPRERTRTVSLLPLPPGGGADTDAACDPPCQSPAGLDAPGGACRTARAISTAATLSRCRATADGRPRLHGIWCARGTSGWARWRMRCSERCAQLHIYLPGLPPCANRRLLRRRSLTEPGTAPGAARNAVSLGSTLIQRLGSEHYGLLIGSRRTVGGTVLRGDGTRAQGRQSLRRLLQATVRARPSRLPKGCIRVSPDAAGCGAGTVELGSPLLGGGFARVGSRTGDTASKSAGALVRRAREREGSRRRDDPDCGLGHNSFFSRCATAAWPAPPPCPRTSGISFAMPALPAARRCGQPCQPLASGESTKPLRGGGTWMRT